METPNRFIIIDTDEINSFVSCKAIMLASRETTIQTFNDPDKGLNYLKGRPTSTEKNRTILFVNADIPGMKGWEFIEQFNELDQQQKKKTEIYVLCNVVDHNDRDYIRQYPFVKGFLEKPLSRDRVTECIISF
jgi:two-component SAPR family response regulator